MCAARDKNICRLDIPVDNSTCMRRVERIRNLDGERQQGLHLHRLIADQMLERCSIQKFHDDEGFAVLLADVINRADIRMIQSGSSLRLALKTSQGLGIARHVVG